MYLHYRIGPTLPDGKYELVPQVEVQETQSQEEAVAAAEGQTQQLVEPSSAQAEGKPRNISPILKVPVFML
jgi:hypothetical protein